MSETSKMGLFGSKEGNTSSNTGQSNKDESPERYAPYSVDSDSETYDTEALSIMDINDIIGIQTEPVGESTLESEIAALSEIITDTNVTETSAEVNEIQKMEFDSTTNMVPVENIEKLTTNESSVEVDSNVDETKSDTEKCISDVAVPQLDSQDTKGGVTEGSKDVTAVSKSLQLIGEAYDSDDSQDSESDGVDIGQQPKIIFSYKPLVEKRSSEVIENENCEVVQNTIIENVNESTSADDDSAYIQVEKQNIKEEATICEKIEEDKVEPLEESRSEKVGSSDCENAIVTSSDDVRQESSGTIVHEAPQTEEVLQSECYELVKEVKSPLKTIDDAVTTDAIPVESIVLPSDTENCETENVGEPVVVETEEHAKIDTQKLNAMEIDVSEEIQAHSNTTDSMRESESDSGTLVELNENASADDVDTPENNNRLESEELIVDSTAEITESLLHESNVESESATAAKLVEGEGTVEESSVSTLDENTLDAKSTGADVTETCEPVVESETIPESISDSTNEEIVKSVSIESSVDESPAITLDCNRSSEIEMMHPDILESDEQTEVMDVATIPNEYCTPKIEEPDATTPPEPEDNQLVAVPAASESPNENEDSPLGKAQESEECGDSTTEFVDALSPTQFNTGNISEPIEIQSPQLDVIESMNEEMDIKEEFSDSIEILEGVTGDKYSSELQMPSKHQILSESSSEKIDPMLDLLQDNSNGATSEQNKNIDEGIEMLIAAPSEAETSELDSKQVTSELSINSADAPLPHELEEQIETALTSSDSGLPLICDQANIIEPDESSDLHTNIDDVTIPHIEKLEKVVENDLPDVPDAVENTPETVEVPDLTSILEEQSAQGEQNDITEPALLSEDISSATTTVIDDIKENLPSQPDELLKQALEEPISVHTDDSLDGILDLDLMPNIDEVERRDDEPTVADTEVATASQLSITEKESPLDILLPHPAIATVSQADDYLNDVIDTINDAENEAIDTATKNIDDSTVELIPSLTLDENQPEDNGEIIGEQTPKELQRDTNDMDSSELEIPFTLTEEDKLEIPDEILNDPLGVVDTDIDALQANTEISNDILDNSLTDTVTSISASGINTAVTNDIFDVPLSVVDSGIDELRENLEESNDISHDPLSVVEPSIEELQLNDQVSDAVLDDSLAAVNVAMEDSTVDTEIPNDLLDDASTVVISAMSDLQENVEKTNDILNDPLVASDSGIELLQANTEISELESAVKFLQESEDHDIEAASVLSPKMIEDIVRESTQVEDPSAIYSSNQEMCEDSSDLGTELERITTDPIAISEAEIINEAAKLESEKKLNEETIDPVVQQWNIEDNRITDDDKNDSRNEVNIEPIKAINVDIPATTPPTQSILPVKSSIIPKTSILEERLREPPKIEIPIVDPPRLCEIPTTPKTSLLIPRDSRLSNYQKMMESPKSSLEKPSRDELKTTDTPRRDPEKLDIENVGSPRIILKIAKSALADCAEPRSPKSPKIRSATNSPNPEDSPGQKLGKIKLKLSKGCHPSIIPNDNTEDSSLQWHTEGSSSLSPLGMKIKLSKSGDASIVQHELKETPKHVLAGSPRRTESPLGMKIKLSKCGDASIIQPDKPDDETNRETRVRDKTDVSQEMMKRTDSPFGMKIKLSTTGDASIVSSEHDESKDPKIKDKGETHQDNQKRSDSHMGMKIKLSKKGGATILPANDKEKIEMPKSPRRTESPLGMKIKLSRTGDASIIHSELIDDQVNTSLHESTTVKDGDSMTCTTKRSESSIGMKIKLSKDGDATIVHTEKQEEEQQEIKRIDSTIGMKIKLSKSGDASIIQSQMTEVHEERSNEMKAHKSSDTTTIESMKIRLSKTGHGTIIANDNDTSQRSKEFMESHHIFAQKREQLVNRSEVTIEPIQIGRRPEPTLEIPQKRKDSVTLLPIETKKAKMDNKLSQILPEVTIQPIATREKPIHFEQSNSSAISRQQLNVISQEISITQLRPNKPAELSVSEKLRKMLTKTSSNATEECEIIGHQPELIIVNENSNSSQDIMIIDEVPPLRMPEVKIPRKRGRPRRNAIAMQFQQPPMQIPTDPLALDDIPHQLVNNLGESKEYERPRRTCRSQKSYAPPRRGRGRGRGKRKFDRIDLPVPKRARLDHNLAPMENCSTALITLDDEVADVVPNDSSELYKALRQPLKGTRLDILAHNSVTCTVALKNCVDALLEPRLMARLEGRDPEATPTKTNQGQLITDQLKKDPKDSFGAPDNQNWLTPSSKKNVEIHRNDGISTVQVIDEETRMSAESFSRSQTPARNMSVNASETTINEESQGSVLSTATTESEKVKVRNRRMEISFDPDEGPFTVDKIAEYEWPIDRKGETFMIQEQISQYLGVKSFKRKYPDLKRRMVDMEERNFLRENALVSEAMCDMGLTAIYSSEVLDIMCSDFPDQYEEYRKHMREKQIKEHSKKQKELSAAATAEKNRIDLAEMAVQSALSWNVNLNKARRESRRCSLDLQTFTIHVPKKLQKIEEESKLSHYPVALIPGQYTDYYREYTSAELRYYPLNTVIYGPMRPNERKFDSQSEGSQSDSDSDSSSDDSSCSSSEGTQDTEESQSTMDDVDIELSNQKDKSLKCKMCLKNLNKNNKSEVLIQCGTCSGHVHPSCIDLTLDMVPHIQAYAWQCTDCKTCAQCHDPADEDKMLFCDMCDRGYHIYCVGLRRVPQGRWHCQECAICASCGSREAGGVNADRNSVALWQHEYKKGDKNTRVYVSTLCVPCSKLWRKGRYCPHCSRCHTVPRLDTDENLVHCSACDKYLHLECVESKDLIVDRKNYQCDLCIQNRQRIAKPSVSRVIRA